MALRASQRDVDTSPTPVEAPGDPQPAPAIAVTLTERELWWITRALIDYWDEGPQVTEDEARMDELHALLHRMDELHLTIFRANHPPVRG